MTKLNYFNGEDGEAVLFNSSELIDLLRSPHISGKDCREAARVLAYRQSQGFLSSKARDELEHIQRYPAGHSGTLQAAADLVLATKLDMPDVIGSWIESPEVC